MRRGFHSTLALCACGALASCASSDRLRVGAGGRGSFTFANDHIDPNDPRFEDAGRGAAAADVTLGVERVQALAGYEWTHFQDDYFAATLLGLRVFVYELEGASGIYVTVLGRDIDGSHERTPFFDGFDTTVGVLWPMKLPILCDMNAGWTYIDGDAIREGRDSASEFRIGFGLRIEW